jgi:predicted aspartyl protease
LWDPQFFKGEGGSNPDATVDVHYHNGSWSIIHHLADSKIVARETQYGITNRPDAVAGRATWGGHLRRNPYLYMQGQLFRADDGGWQYGETLMDRLHDDAQIMSVTFLCRRTDITTASTPTYAPSPTSSYGGFSVPLVIDNAGLHMNVKLGPMVYDMIVDTGATYGMVTATVAESLVASGMADWGNDSTIVLADGSEHPQHSVVVHSIEVSGHSASNVRFGVTPNNNAAMLFGFNALSQFGKFTVDASKSRIMFQ